ncbi:hypothetical protein LSUB1_G003650, partial [Lachnellula subtilissima]
AVIKHFPKGLSKAQYKRELHNYSFESIAKSPFIRSMLDLIGHDEPSTTTATATAMYGFRMDGYGFMATAVRRVSVGLPIPRISARSTLEALVVIDGEDGFLTDVNPNNVFLSGVDCPLPTVKLGDLGNRLSPNIRELMSAGPMYNIRFQGVIIRAPEVWIDAQPLTPKADVWSLGVTMAHWLAGRMVFGAADKIIEDCVEHWCIAKLMRLVGPLPKPDPSKTEIVDEIALAEFLERETFAHPETGVEQPFIRVGTIRQELEKVEGPIDRDCIRFIESFSCGSEEETKCKGGTATSLATRNVR